MTQPTFSITVPMAIGENEIKSLCNHNHCEAQKVDEKKHWNITTDDPKNFFYLGAEMQTIQQSTNY